VQAQLRDTEDSARGAGRRLIPLSAKVEGDFDTAFATLVQQRADALLIGSDPFFTSRRDRLVALSARHKLPTIYEYREFAAAGGLISYGTNRVDVHRQLGVYTGRILKGAKPGDLPVLQPTKFELVINVKTAKANGRFRILTLGTSARGRDHPIIEHSGSPRRSRTTVRLRTQH